MFAPGLGIPEDPGTGSASGPLGAYLLRHNAVPGGTATRLVSLQGVRIDWIRTKAPFRESELVLV
jgi:trans-2,3-dihydro-3-hydroxyanthranilate isomerase